MKQKTNSLVFTLTAIIVLSLVPSALNAAQGARIGISQNTNPLYLSIVWHQHQPTYLDPATNIYEQPWVYMHSTNSYPWMADLHKKYPDVNATINITPSLLKQMDDYANEVEFDRRIQVALMDEASMSDENKSVVLQYFFDINPQFVTGRYEYLQQKAGQYPTMAEKIAAFTDAEILDLKVMFFLRWINEEYRKNDFLLNTFDARIDEADVTTAKFSHGDLNTVLSKGRQILQSVVQRHIEAMQQGNLEITTTPFYHPILPLLIDLNSARESPGNENLPLPENNTGWIEDAREQINRGIQSFTDHFGGVPNGMWPSEEAVSKDVIPLMADAGIKWFVSDRQILANSLGVADLTPQQLYQMYKVSFNGSSVAAIFRDTALSDKIGFTYSGMHPDDAAQDFIDELRARYDSLQSAPQGSIPYLVTVALDGENAWEHYTYDIDGDGKNEYTGNLFRETLYQKIEQAQNEGWLKTVTPNQFLQQFSVDSMPEITNLASGSWISGELNTWIGEPEENIAWDWLIQTRNDLVAFEQANPGYNTSDAWEALYAAEGSDWFWWYGADQDSARDEVFDWGYKTLLRSVYTAIGYTNDEILDRNPLLFLKQSPRIAANFPGKMTDFSIDGSVGANEWDLSYRINDTVIDNGTIDFLYTGIADNLSHLLFRIDLNQFSVNDFVGFYFNDPRSNIGDIYPLGVDRSNVQNALGFQLNFAVVYTFNSSELSYWKATESGWTKASFVGGLASYGSVLEVAIPLSFFNYTGGDFFSIRVTYTNSSGTVDVAPEDGPLVFQVPLTSVDFNVVFEMEDPEGDEWGDYPLNNAFEPYHGLFDILDFKIGYDTENLIISMKFGEITNPWNAPSGFSHPLIQVYIDKDRISGSGNVEPDQNANVKISPDFAWETLVRADGWLKYGLDQDLTQFGGVDAIADTLEKRITITAPLSMVGTPTEDWAYVVLVGSQDFQAYRERLSVAGEWKLGGGDDGPYDPNVVDMLVPEGADQDLILSDYSVAEQRQAEVIGVGPKVSFAKDEIAPTVQITSPTNGTQMTYDSNGQLTITFEFTAFDNVAVDHFDLFAENILLADDQPLTNGSNSFTVTIEKSEVGTGEIQFSLLVFDGPDETAYRFGKAVVTLMLSDTGGSSSTIPNDEPSGGGFLSLPTWIFIASLFSIPVLKRKMTNGNVKS
ncbi:MAG: hypothetical protein D6732_09750 [Methanobacteriota archaeon]|nr:MAG: hypothetical protein D6732_09750 [Euryarchaeota archaeon]